MFSTSETFSVTARAQADLSICFWALTTSAFLQLNVSVRGFIDENQRSASFLGIVMRSLDILPLRTMTCAGREAWHE